MTSRRVLTEHIAKELAGGADRSEVLQQLAAYLVQHKLTGDVDMVVADIQRNLARHGAVHATVTTARPLTDELRASVESYVKRVESANTVVLDEVVEPRLYGGVVVETPNKRLDASIATQLKRLKSV